MSDQAEIDQAEMIAAVDADLAVLDAADA